jgi:hypothetical protein
LGLSQSKFPPEASQGALLQCLAPRALPSVQTFQKLCFQNFFSVIMGNSKELGNLLFELPTSLQTKDCTLEVKLQIH